MILHITARFVRSSNQGKRRELLRGREAELLLHSEERGLEREDDVSNGDDAHIREA